MKKNETGLGGAVKLVVRTFLEEKHYHALHRILSDQWKSCHSLTAAVKLMEAHGVKLTEEEEMRLTQLPEERMIDALVARMPGQSREQFEHFFLQLSLIASTTTRLRTALEAGKPDVVEEALDSAENVGIINFLLKMAVVQAGTEVLTKEGEQKEWMADTSLTVGPLLMASAESMQSQKALAQVKAQLGMSRVQATSKTKKVLMNLVGGSNETLLATIMNSWDDAVKKQKREDEIEKEYEEEIMAANQKLIDFKNKNQSGIRNLMMRNIAADQGNLIQMCWDAFMADVLEKKDKNALEGDSVALQNKLKNFADSTAANAKKVLSRMNAGNDDALVSMVFQSYVSFHNDYKQNKEIEDAVKAKEAVVADFMSKRTEKQKNVLMRMVGSTDTGLITQCFQAWTTHAKEVAEAEKLQEQLDEKMNKLTGFAARNTQNAMGAANRLAQSMNDSAVLGIFIAWKRDCKVETMKRYGKEQNEKRKTQLKGVKGLFKNFASELDAGLQEGTPRVEAPAKPPDAPPAAPQRRFGGGETNEE